MWGGAVKACCLESPESRKQSRYTKVKAQDMEDSDECDKNRTKEGVRQKFIEKSPPGQLGK